MCGFYIFKSCIIQQTYSRSDLSQGIRTFCYLNAQGTSYACALVSGVSALLVSKVLEYNLPNLPLNFDIVKNLLIAGAIDDTTWNVWGTPGWDPNFGFGRVNADRSLDVVQYNIDLYVSP